MFWIFTEAIQIIVNGTTPTETILSAVPATYPIHFAK